MCTPREVRMWRSEQVQGSVFWVGYFNSQIEETMQVCLIPLLIDCCQGERPTLHLLRSSTYTFSWVYITSLVCQVKDFTKQFINFSIKAALIKLRIQCTARAVIHILYKFAWSYYAVYQWSKYISAWLQRLLFKISVKIALVITHAICIVYRAILMQFIWKLPIALVYFNPLLLYMKYYFLYHAIMWNSGIWNCV